MNYEDFMKRDARLTILKELHSQTSGALNENILLAVLDAFGHRRSREWVRTQLQALAELGAITIKPAGSVLIASITADGIDHVERRIVIDGIARPSPGA